MKRYFPVVVALLILGVGTYVAVIKKNASGEVLEVSAKDNNIGTFNIQSRCARPLSFLQKLKISQPVMIDLSQKRFKGVALLYGRNFQKVLHPDQWEQYEYLSTYTLDEKGNLYLIPTPFISIHPTTFTLQKNIYKLDSQIGKLSIFMHLDDVNPTANNPYGLNTIVYDCDDHTLWAAAIDESDYQNQKGVIYHIDPKTKEILQRIDGFDALTMSIVKSQKGKFLLLGSARDNGLYAYRIIGHVLQSEGIKLFELPNVNEHIRKIKVKGQNRLELQAIPFSYTLIAQTSNNDRINYSAVWNKKNNNWEIKKR